MIGHEFHRLAPLTKTKIPQIWGVGEYAYSKKDRNDKGELSGRQLYISEARYTPPSTPGAHYTDDKWEYKLRTGAGEKARDVHWAREEDLSDDDPRGPHVVPDLIDFSPEAWEEQDKK